MSIQVLRVAENISNVFSRLLLTGVKRNEHCRCPMKLSESSGPRVRSTREQGRLLLKLQSFTFDDLSVAEHISVDRSPKFRTEDVVEGEEAGVGDIES
jgi:hypothetical protein